MRNTATWISAVVLVLLAIGVHCSTIEYPNQVVNESPNGLSLEYPTNDGPTDSMLSYLISTTGATVNTDTSEEYPPYVEAKIFLGNMMYAGEPVVWTNASVQGDWTKLKKSVQVDPCKGTQTAKGPAFLFVDGHNVTLNADIAVVSRPLQTLAPNVVAHSDASSCFHTSYEGAPLQCHEFFYFDFSAAATPSPAGYSWGLTIESDNGNPLPFTRAVLAAGTACPTRPGNEENFLDIALHPESPGNSPTKITLSGLAIGTHYKKWWIQLKGPEIEPVAGPTPFSITAHYDVVAVPENPPPVQITPSPRIEPVPEQPQPQPLAKTRKPVPVWAIAIICVGCALIAAGALFFAWRLTHEKPSSNSYEIY